MRDKPNNAAPDTPAFQPEPYVQLRHPEWSKNAVIYEVNIRQYTPEGTFGAFAGHLPRLNELGVDILWLMPIHPIGEKNRKSEMGSYYAVQDYYAVHPDYGTLEDFKSLVRRIHELGMYVIIDWVGNHSAWDNPLVKEHPEWYARNREGGFQPPLWYDWEDVITFDYSRPGLRKYMAEAMQWWLRETDIDGFRCDVAGFVPLDFWEQLRPELESIKPAFMLAEWESRDMHRLAFDMTYAWDLYERMREVWKGNRDARYFHEFFAHHVNAFPADGYRMTFVDNHDKNSWQGSPQSQFGDALEAYMLLCCTVAGMPLVYNGQEAGMDKPLAFFEKDAIEWKAHPYFGFYQKLFRLKKQNRALWNGSCGGVMEQVSTDREEAMIAFVREKEGDKVFVVFNFSRQPLTTRLKGNVHAGNYTELFSEEKVSFLGNDSLQLEAWGYRLYYS